MPTTVPDGKFGQLVEQEIPNLRTELVMSPSIRVEMAKGFSLYMVEAILIGRADEIVDLAKTNLRR